MKATITILGGALAFAVPAISLAAPAGWSEGERILEQHLQPGKTPADYPPNTNGYGLYHYLDQL